MNLYEKSCNEKAGVGKFCGERACIGELCGWTQKAVRVLLRVLAAILALFIGVVLIYWFNLDTKLVKAIEPFMTRHYDNLDRDRRL